MPQRITNKAYGNHPLANYKKIGIIIMMLTAQRIWAEPLSTPLNIHVPVTIDLPVQPLAESLKQFAKQSDSNIVFDPSLVQGKVAPAVKGNYDSAQALQKLLSGSGLEATTEDKTILIKRERAKKPDEPLKVEVQPVEVRAKRFYEVGPLPGLGLTKEEIPGNVQSITAQQIKDSHSISLSDLMNSQLQSVNVNDYQGNPFQMDVTYRGFTASPQLGTPQGLSVFFDGIRVNEPFGDVVNWDMIPMNALSGLDVFPGSNPIFGLGTLGGALSMKTKNGFDNPGVEADMLAGAFGRKQFQLSAGGSKGDVAGFVALNLFDEDGWRDNSPSKVNQIFSKLSYRNEALSLDGSLLYASNNLVGNGMIPTEMYQQNSSSVFSSPDTTRNKLMQFQIASAFQVNDNFSITGQVYNRNSDRKAVTGDINEDFGGFATRKPTSSESPVCAYSSTNVYKIPDYYVVDDAFFDAVNNPTASISTVALAIANGAYTNLAGAIAAGDVNTGTLNQTLPSDYAAAATATQANMFNGKTGLLLSGTYISTTNDSSGVPVAVYQNIGGTWSELVSNSANYYEVTDANGNVTAVKWLIPKEPINGTNGATCGSDSVNSSTSVLDGTTGQIRVLDANGMTIRRDGKDATGTGGSTSGYIDGTPIAIITTNEIKQEVKGGAVQLNWSADQHKFMVGSSIDHAIVSYSNSQLLGLLDANRKAYLDPLNIGEEFTAASTPISNNNFSGSSDTRSLYMSENFSPNDNLHFSFGARYNYTVVSTLMRTRKNTSGVDVSDFKNGYLNYLLCTGLGLDSCDSSALNDPVVNPIANDSNNYFGPYVKESFTYHSLNPSLGATWSPQENLNLYANWSQGARTPSTIELGCAYDRTPVNIGTAANPVYQSASLTNKTSCTLPSSLSGDPYLKQVTSQTYEIGARGSLNEHLQWNASVYRTDLSDDIYLVGFTATKSFFDTVGDTRRQGIEMGLTGKYDKFDFKVNYSLTDATFQSTSTIANSYNSSTDFDVRNNNTYLLETIHPGNRMPGIPLNNLNASVGYQMTDKWSLRLNMVAHGSSYARGNENNEHQPGTVNVVDSDGQGGFIYSTKTFYTSGKTAGFAVLNFQTSYDFGRGWSGTVQVNNLLDKEYFSASRLGANPFSPSINGAIGPSGWNYNSSEWLGTTFEAPGAPRAAWVSVRYEFDADKK